jgi:lipopolysaccharide export system protein LptA
MPISTSRLRRWFAGAAIFVCVAVLGTYFYAKHRVQNALKQVPGKIGIEIQQSAQGFTISKSEQGRTLFKLQAKKAIQFKQGLRAELHDVTITLYGRDSSRFDQVYGQDFEYDQQSGNVTSQGDVSIDLQANPQGILHPDQTPPKELKNPLHLKTTGLVFNQKTGDAWTPAEVDFRVPQASGSAVGAKYVANEGVLTLESQVRIAVNGATPSTIFAEQATLQKAPREIVLRRTRAESPGQRGQADEVTLFLRDDNALARTAATGNVQIESAPVKATAHLVQGGRTRASAPTWSRVSAQRLEVKMKPANLVESAVLTGNVHLTSEGAQPAEAWAGRTDISFAGHNVITKIHAAEQVRLLQHQPSSDNKTPTLAAENAARMGHPPITKDGRGRPSPHEQKEAQDVEVTAPAMDFVVANGNRLARAETIGAPQISLLPNGKQGETRVTADKFTAKFDSQGQLRQVHGEANARVVASAPPHSGTPEPDRVSTSDSVDAYFRQGTGIENLVQEGRFTYTSGTQRAAAERARYTPADQILTLTGSPRIVDAGMATTARTVRLNRSTSDAFAQGDVKTTYSDLKPEPSGALLASSDPIHVTAESMTAHNSPAIATYKGNARLWQNANVIEAPTIQFQKEARTAEAESVSGQKVSTVLVGTDKNGKGTPVRIISSRLSYRDSERKAHFEGGVTAQGSDLTITSNQMDVFLASSHGTPAAPQSQNLSKLEKMVASGSVLITEPNRRATGDKLTYTASDDKFVLTGGSPSIFDAEHGKITGVSLTLFRHDDRVVVDGDSSSPAVTQTRVVR